jgi:hypothetical protein
VDRCRRAEGFEEPRDDVDLDVLCPQCGNDPQHPVVVVLGERDDDPLDVSGLDDLGDVLRLSDELSGSEIAPHLSRIRVDEPDQVDAVLGMLKQLPADQLPDLTCSDDQSVLDVRRMAPGERPCRPPRDDHREECEQPKRRELPLMRVAETDEP